jgi:xanthine dehydrogenase YagR molybdenum-binding subunit
VPTAAAVANAVAHATGIRPTALPITPARILDALGKVPKREVKA